MIRKTILVTSAFALALGLAVGLTDRSAVAAPPAAPKIAFVDIQVVLKASKRAKETELELNKEQKRIEDDFETAQKALAARAKDLITLDVRTKAYRDMKFEIQLQGHKNKLTAQSEDEALKLLARDEMANIYKEIQTVVAAYAKANGIDAVLTINTGELGGNTLQEITFEIAMRPVLYAHKDFDVTAAIVKALNEKK